MVYTNERPSTAVERCVTRQSTRPNHHLGWCDGPSDGYGKKPSAHRTVPLRRRESAHTQRFCPLMYTQPRFCNAHRLSWLVQRQCWNRGIPLEATMGSIKRSHAFDPLDLEIIDLVYEVAWGQISAAW